MSRKCQLLMGCCSKGIGNSNTDRIERFLIAKRHHPRWKYRFPTYVIVRSYWQKRHMYWIDAEEMRVHTRVACERGMEWSYAPTESTSSHPRRMIMILVTDAMESLDTEPIAETIHSLFTWIAVYLNCLNRWVLLAVDLDRWQDIIAIKSKESPQSLINWFKSSHWDRNGVFLRIA